MKSDRSAVLRQFLAFAVTGGVAALVNLLSRYGLSSVTQYEAAVAIAYLIGMTTAFLLARRFVFPASGQPLAVEYGRFGLVNVAGFIQVWIVSVTLVRVVFPKLHFEWRAEEVAHLIGVVSPIAVSYYGHRNFSFKRADPPLNAGTSD
jgi:putative flippase GtrA